MLTGVVLTAPSPIAYANPYSGAQTADPSVAPSGSFVWANYLDSVSLSGMFAPASAGAVNVTGTCSPVVAANALAVSGITTVRVYDAAGNALFDIPAIGVTSSSVSVAGVGVSITALPISIAKDTATASFSVSTVNQVLDNWCGTSPTAIEFFASTLSASNLDIYDGVMPASADDPPVGTLLCQIPLYSFGASSIGTAYLVSVMTGTAIATGTATYCRISKTIGAKTYTLQCVATNGWGAGLMLDNLSVSNGAPLSLIYAQFSSP
jgi:hypothetical protein